MVFNPIDSMNNTGAMLDLIAKRQKVLGENLSNVDTPGYSRKDVDFNQHLNMLGGKSFETRLSSKMGAPPIFEDTAGGTVNSGHEIMELQKNSLLYTMATKRMSNIITEMKTVINVGK